MRNNLNGATLPVNGPKEMAHESKAGGKPQHIFAATRLPVASAR